MKVTCQSYQLKLRDPFTIARGTVSVQPTLIVSVEHDDLVGYGEATTNSYYGITLETMEAALEKVRPTLQDYKLENPAELWAELDSQLSDCRFAQCALDCAVWDLYAKMHQLPLWKLWGFEHDAPCPPSCFTIGLDEVDVMVRKMKEASPWPVFKIKLDQTGGIDLVRELRRHTSSRFRVDANCSWQPGDVARFCDELGTLDVELVEQPLAAEQYDEMRSLKGKCALPLMADESCQVEADIDRCIESFDAVNVKLVKCGGLTPARRMITRAKQNGLQVMVGCMTESSIGIAAGVHLMPLLDFADLDGALLLSNDIAEGLEWTEGSCPLPAELGLGVKLRA
ncbi:MAG: dipeptide epimerase [Aureliella sp.]